jgi:hypothetical protein
MSYGNNSKSTQEIVKSLHGLTKKHGTNDQHDLKHEFLQQEKIARVEQPQSNQALQNM